MRFGALLCLLFVVTTGCKKEPDEASTIAVDLTQNFIDSQQSPDLSKGGIVGTNIAVLQRQLGIPQTVSPEKVRPGMQRAIKAGFIEAINEPGRGARYTYKWTRTVPEGLVSGDVLYLGHLVVDSCNRLSQASEFHGDATCNVHVEITRPAGVIFGDAPTTQTLHAAFEKQYGNWVVTQIEYVPPRYSGE
jgi:hypothetical protein